MKVLFVCSQNNNDFEVSPFIQSQADSLKEKGVDVDIFIVKINKLKGVISNIRKLRKLSQDYDIVHAHYSTNGMFAILAGYRNKLVISLLGSDLLGIKNEKNKQRISGRIIRLITSIVMIRAQFIIVKTQEMFKILPLNHQKKAFIIPNGVDFNLFKPIDREIAIEKLGIENKNHILFTGRTTDKNKNFKLLKMAFDSINDDTVNLLTTYPTEYSLMPYYMNAACCLILTSFTEGSSNVIKEALACNLPIISVAVGDVEENISNINNCYIVNYDYLDIASKILMLIKPEKKSDGRAKSQRLNNNNISVMIIDIYNKLDSALTSNS